MPLPKHKLIVFDLDRTLSESKMPMEKEMIELFLKLIQKKKVAVISGGGWRQFETQFLHGMPHSSESFNNLFLLPASGTKMYLWKGSWQEMYSEDLNRKEKEKIMDAMRSMLKITKFDTETKIFGQQIEDRGSQITFSGLGQHAPVELKLKWDVDRKKRERVQHLLQARLPEFDVRIGGATSVDITHRGVNKAYGIRKLEKMLNMSTEEIIFVGDALFHGGNDYPARATGVDCIQVKGPEETKQLIKNWLDEASIKSEEFLFQNPSVVVPLSPIRS